MMNNETGVHGTSIDIVEVMYLSVIHTEGGDPAISHPFYIYNYNLNNQMPYKCTILLDILGCFVLSYILYYNYYSYIL